MKVRDLVEILENLPQEDEIYFLPENSNYPEDFGYGVRRNMEIRAFWGSDFKGTIMYSEGQVGGI